MVIFSAISMSIVMVIFFLALLMNLRNQKDMKVDPTDEHSIVDSNLPANKKTTKNIKKDCEKKSKCFEEDCSTITNNSDSENLMSQKFICKLKIAKRNKKRNTDTLLCIKTWLEGKEYIVED
ncbi:hypothetical protein NGRA_3611, partial [Nosema granulosis]